MIVIGASLGGMRALQVILSSLPASFSRPIGVVMHRHKDTDDFLVEYLQQSCVLPVGEVVDKDPILPGRVYLAPADYHLLVDGSYFSLSVDELVQYARPSVDVLFESAADIFGPAAIGVVLTGGNHDGTKGARQIRNRGGIVVVENPATAVCPTMPAAALAVVPDAHRRDLAEIAPLLIHLTSGPLPNS